MPLPVTKMHSIENPGALEECAKILEAFGGKSGSTEAIAVDTVNYLYSQLSDGAGEPCALVRFFRTIPYRELTPDLRQMVDKILKKKPNERTTCLTLLSSRGSKSEWNNRFQSKDHQVIPLISNQMIQAAPMVAQLIKRLNIDVAQVLEPSPTLFLLPKQKNYNVMYVPEALNDPAIVYQDGFVKPEGIHSVIGFGGLLPTGDMFAVLAFMRVFISEETAKRFGKLAAAVETAITKVGAESQKKAKILIADEQDGAERLTKLFGANHEITIVTSLSKAKKAAHATNFDVIICGTRFDDSRMFDFLMAIKHDKQLRSKPFICINQSPTKRFTQIDSFTPKAAKLIGAVCYLEAVKLSDSELVDTISSYLPKDIWMSDITH
jgi:hypothetical protein